VGGQELLADPAIAYAGSPRLEQSIAHRLGADDTYTAVMLSEGLMAGLAPRGRTLSTAIPVTGDVAVAHRLLVARARRSADSFELAERATRLAGLLLAPHARAGSAARRPATAVSRRRLAEAAREFLATDPGWSSLTGIANRVGCSPHYLSRVFHRETGMTLTTYRNRLRVLRALDALEAGERDLSVLAARLGFADHAHLTRTVTNQCGGWVAPIWCFALGQ
jgi:AraC-like DNA-binding protein